MEIEPSMDPTFENSLRTPVMKAQRILDLGKRIRELADEAHKLTQEKSQLMTEREQLKRECEHVMPDGESALDSDDQGQLLCRMCLRKKTDLDRMQARKSVESDAYIVGIDEAEEPDYAVMNPKTGETKLMKKTKGGKNPW